jgi:hypothetical protein
MSNFDLIDDYVANRLSDSERADFEQAMRADPALSSEVGRQSLIVEGIRKARAAELKAILNKVPVGGGASLWTGVSLMRMAATVGVIAVVGTGLYFYLKDSKGVIQNVPGAEIPMDSLMPKDSTSEPIIENKVKPEQETQKKEVVVHQAEQATVPSKEATTPKVEVVDPSTELLSDDSAEANTSVTPKSGISVANIQVERDSKNKQFHFHYQFLEGKLFLLGPFDEALYEILEVHGDSHALFLFFKDNFYHLDETKASATELTPIRDRSLLLKLKEFRDAR